VTLSTILFVSTAINVLFVFWPSLVTGPAATAAGSLFTAASASLAPAGAL
jgi:hypothetical protein